MEMLRKFRFSIEHLWAVTVIVGVFVFVSTHPIRPQDFWWHMAIGREILSSGRIPIEDSYSYTMAGEFYPAYQIYWLMEVVLYSVFQAGGGTLVVFIQSLLIDGAYAIILLLCYLVSRSWRIAAFGVMFAAALGLNDWNVRPQAVTFLLGALILLAINRVQFTRKKIWLAVFTLTMFIWSNSHGTFPIGLVLVGVWWLDEVWQLFYDKGKWQDYLIFPSIAALASLLACLLTPQGVGIVKYLRAMTVNPVIQNLVTEWAAPSFGSLGGTIFFIGLILSACVLAISPKRPSFFQIALFVLFSLLGLKTMRGVVWFGIVMAPIMADHLKAIIDTYKPHKKNHKLAEDSRSLNMIFLFGLLILAALSLPWFKQYLPLPPLKAGIFSSETPIDATKFILSEQLPNPLFNAMSFGSYLIWEAQPDYPVFIDPRIDLFDANIISEYISASGGEENWSEILDSYGIQTVMASPIEQGGLIKRLDSSALWERIYSDHAVVIFTRK